MSSEVYQEMLTVMQNRRGPYAGMDIPEFYALIEELFTEEEAEVNNAMSRKPETAEQIADKMNRGEGEIRSILETMADKGLCATFKEDGIRLYLGVAFMPGIFEYQFMPGNKTERDIKIAKLIHDYKKAYNEAKGVVPIKYPVTRVISVDRTINVDNMIHTYDQVATYIDKYDSIGVGTCYCRHGAELRGEDVHGMPMDVCMWFGKIAEYAVERLGGKKVTKQEARAVLDRAEEAGLVHMSRNTTEDIDFLCNCDRWHCEVVKSVLNQPKPGLIFNSGYQPGVNPDLCTACETCIDRCPAEALTMGDADIPVANLDRCFGCGACATGCPEEAITMEAKADFPIPPKDTKELVAAIKASHSD